MPQLRIWLTVLSLILVSGCGGGGDESSGPESTAQTAGGSTVSSEPIVVVPENVRGDWDAHVVETSRTGCQGLSTQDVDVRLFVDQSDAVVNVASSSLCANGGTETGGFVADGFLTGGNHVVACNDGTPALLFTTTQFSEISGSTANDVIFTTELGCPGDYCYYEQHGSATRVQKEPTTCSSSNEPAPMTVTVPGTSVTPTPSDISDSSGSSNRPCSCSVRGCCSHHGGVAACSGNGQVLCSDGSMSPSCHC